MVTTTKNTVNGIALDTLRETIGAIARDPGLGSCQFRVQNQWIDGAHNYTTVSEFHAARQVQHHRRAFDLHADEPPMLAGNDGGPNPVEYLLTALVSCMTTSMVAHAAVRGIRINALQSEVEGDLDLQGFLGLDERVDRGYTHIRVSFRVDSDVEDLATLEELAKLSPVYSTLQGGTRVSVTLRRL